MQQVYLQNCSHSINWILTTHILTMYMLCLAYLLQSLELQLTVHGCIVLSEAAHGWQPVFELYSEAPSSGKTARKAVLHSSHIG